MWGEEEEEEKGWNVLIVSTSRQGFGGTHCCGNDEQRWEKEQNETSVARPSKSRTRDHSSLQIQVLLR